MPVSEFDRRVPERARDVAVWMKADTCHNEDGQVFVGNIEAPLTDRRRSPMMAIGKHAVIKVRGG